jgi:hypothetical protein
MNSSLFFNNIKKHFRNKTYQNNLLKYEPLTNPQIARENLLYIIRENYISCEELINGAIKQYKYWTNLLVEEINNCIKNNTPPNQKILARDSPSIKKNFRKYFSLENPDEFLKYEYTFGKMHLGVNQLYIFKNKTQKHRLNSFYSWSLATAFTIDEQIKQSGFWVARMKYFHKHRRPSRRIIYSAENYLREVNLIGKNDPIMIIEFTRQWNIHKFIDIMRILNAGIDNPTLLEAYIKNPCLLEHHEQITEFLEPIEIDDFPCKP